MDIIAVVYGAVLVLAYPLVMQPARVALQGLCKNDKTWLFVLIGAGYVGITILLSCVLESIVQIFGLFSSSCGFFLYFLVPIATAF